MLRPLTTFALALSWLLTGANLINFSASAATPQQDAAAQKKAAEAKQAQQPPPVPSKNSKDPTGEQVAEFVIYFYGSRQGMAQVQKSSVERGRTTRFADDGRSEEITYERQFMRGETSAKDRVRLNQKTPAAEYALVYNGGRIFGVINGTSFTPRQEAVAPFLADRLHGIGALLRYKEDGSTVTYVGKDKQKNIDLWVVDLADKEKRRTRYYVSAKTFRVLWLEYEETPPGASKPVQYRRTFHDYRYAQGQLVSYRTVLYADGRQAEETNVTNVTFGTKMDDALFKDSSETTASN